MAGYALKRISTVMAGSMSPTMCIGWDNSDSTQLIEVAADCRKKLAALPKDTMFVKRG